MPEGRPGSSTPSVSFAVGDEITPSRPVVGSGGRGSDRRDVLRGGSTKTSKETSKVGKKRMSDKKKGRCEGRSLYVGLRLRRNKPLEGTTGSDGRVIVYVYESRESVVDGRND